jgi:MFS family permease
MAADTLRIVAMSMLVLHLTGSALLSAIAFGIGFLPELFGGILLGSLADRIRPRLLIAAGYTVEGVATAAIALLPMPVAASLAIIAVTGALLPAFSGGASRLIAELLPGDLYVLGRSVSRMAGGGAQLVGLAFGGIAVAAFGPQRAMLAAACAHLLAALIVRIRLSNYDVPKREGQVSTGAVAQSWRTTRALLRDTRIRGLLLVQWLPPAFVVGAEALIVAYADLRGFPPGSVGLLLASIPAGLFAGHLVIGRFLRPETRTRLVAPLIALLGALVIGLAVAPPLWSVGAILFLTGAAFAYSLGLQRIFVDATPEDHRGQAFVLLGMGLMTFQGLGPLVFGTIAQTSGIRPAMALAGAACVVTALIWWRRSPI